MPSSRKQLPNLNEQWFKACLKDKKLTVRGLAKLLDYNPSTVSLMLRGIRRINHDDAKRLSELLGVGIQEIYKQSGTPVADPDYEKRLTAAKDLARIVQELTNRIRRGDVITQDDVMLLGAGYAAQVVLAG
jgi:transcriptional regulator with XRE-family HTH domain